MCCFVNSSSLLIILFLCFCFISAHSLTPCQAQKKKDETACGGMMGCHIVQCTSQGGYSPMQCHGSTGYCWCVDKSGKEIPNTRTAPGQKPPSCSTEEGENNQFEEHKCDDLCWELCTVVMTTIHLQDINHNPVWQNKVRTTGQLGERKIDAFFGVS